MPAKKKTATKSNSTTTKETKEQEKILFEKVDGSAIYPYLSTKGSAGCDFYSNMFEIIAPWEMVRVTTGIICTFPEDVVLLTFNRSSNPKTKGLILTNGVGVIDSDYYNSKAPITFEFLNISKRPVSIKPGDKIGQGVFFNRIEADNVQKSNKTRNGGFGSTG